MYIKYDISDNNECSTNTHNCNSNAVCTNIDGGFSCKCNSGFQGDGVTCTGEIIKELKIVNLVHMDKL